jgi:hypothetical protein
MLTLSSERFLKIQREAPAEFQQYLVQVTKYHAAKTCKVVNPTDVHNLQRNVLEDGSET